MQEWALIKVAGAAGGAVGSLALIVAKKTVTRLEAWAIVAAGVSLSIFLPTIIAKYVILRYSLVNDIDTLFGLVGFFGLISGLVGYAFVGGVIKLGSFFENNPIPFITKFLGIFGKDK